MHKLFQQGHTVLLYIMRKFGKMEIQPEDYNNLTIHQILIVWEGELPIHFCTLPNNNQISNFIRETFHSNGFVTYISSIARGYTQLKIGTAINLEFFLKKENNSFLNLISCTIATYSTERTWLPGQITILQYINTVSTHH